MSIKKRLSYDFVTFFAVQLFSDFKQKIYLCTRPHNSEQGSNVFVQNTCMNSRGQ